MQLSNRDLKLIASVRLVQYRAKLFRAMLFVCLLLGLLAFFTEMISIDQLAYSLTAIALFAVFVPNGTLKIDELADLLERVRSEADVPERDDIIEALSKK